MDSKRVKELNGSPFGRQLCVLPQKLPKRFSGGGDWELDRGFHLQVLSADMFHMTLAPRKRSGGAATPVRFDLEEHPDEVHMLLWHCPGNCEPSRFSEFAEFLARDERHQCGLILSHTSERLKALLSYPRTRGAWSQTTKPVLQVFQNFPTRSYFTVEKNLYHLGRIGRHLQRWNRIRRMLPW